MKGKPYGSARMLSILAVLTAVSVVLIWLVHFPIIPVAPWLEYARRISQSARDARLRPCDRPDSRRRVRRRPAMT
jgi:hypothetical protein